MLTETKFKQWVRGRWKGWLESFEPRLGSGVGIPDLMVVVERRLVPIELKLGREEDGIVWSEEVRPAQIAWHRQLGLEKVQSWLLIGCGVKAVDGVFLVPAHAMKFWTAGYEIGNGGPATSLPLDGPGFSAALERELRRGF